MNLKNNIFCIDLEWTYETYKFVMCNKKPKKKVSWIESKCLGYLHNIYFLDWIK